MNTVKTGSRIRFARIALKSFFNPFRRWLNVILLFLPVVHGPYTP
ncbi:hypothetical protein [Mucilaginibacter sp.]|nr:hypothetical protein [Mucilaginibacter sp.]